MKIRRIVSLIAVLAISIVGLFAFNSIDKVIASEINNEYAHTFNGGNIYSKKDVGMQIKLDKDLTTKHNNKVAIDSFNAVFKVAGNEFKFNLSLQSTAPAHSSNSSINNEIVLEYESGALKVKLNDKESINIAYSQDTNIELSIENNIFTIKANDISTTLGEIIEVGKKTADLKVKNLSDKQLDITFTNLNGQSLVFNDGVKVVDNTAPSIIINTNLDGFYLPLHLEILIDYSVVDILDSSPKGKLYYQKEGTTTKYFAQDNKICIINLENTSLGDKYTLFFEAKDKAENQAIVIEKTITIKKDNEMPEIDSAFDYNKFKEDITAATFQTGEGNENKYVYLGSGEYFKIPSINGLFKDDVTSQSQFKYNMEYSNRSSANRKLTNVSESSLKIELVDDGLYRFKLQAVDQMSGLSEFTEEFSFYVENTAGVLITAPTINESGFVGTPYTANDFTVKGLSYNKKYELEFLDTKTNAFVKAEEELNGRTFTPEKLGTYRLKLLVSNTDKVNEATSYVDIEINEKKLILKGDSQWLKNNIASIIFLCTGTLSLIGIIVLSLIKPKQDNIETIEVDKKQPKK